MSLSGSPFLCDNMASSLKIRYHFLVKISLRFGLELLGGIVMKGKIHFFVCFVGGRLVSFLEISLLRVCC